LDIYRDRGFEIVSINVDSEKQRISQYLKFRPMRWPVVVDVTDGKAQMITKCGINIVPFSLLVGQDGTVVEMHLNSQTLTNKLTELLGKPDTSPPDGRDETPPPQKDTGSIQSDRNEGTYFVSYGAIEETQEATREARTENDTQKTDSQIVAKDENPYLAPAGLSRDELVEFLLKMEEKPKSIRQREGFDDALLDAAERILKTGEQDNPQQVAYDVKLRTLHRRAIQEIDGAEEQLWQCVQSLQNNPPARIANEVAMLTLEHQLLSVDELPLEQVPALLDQAHVFYSSQQLGERHLRMASATVHAINRLNVDNREGHFQRFGQVFSKSSDKDRNWSSQAPPHWVLNWIGKHIAAKWCLLISGRRGAVLVEPRCRSSKRSGKKITSADSKC
jgi:hypothetical protein